MWVKTKREHQNRYGKPKLPFVKTEGLVYDHPNPRVLIADGTVEKATEAEVKEAREQGVPGSTTEGVGSSTQAAGAQAGIASDDDTDAGSGPPIEDDVGIAGGDDKSKSKSKK